MGLHRARAFGCFGIINMNGRVYDPLTGQFFSPDPFIQAPDNWLNYNRYGYCMNNPLKYTDPSGYYLDEHGFWHEDGSASFEVISPTNSEMYNAYVAANMQGWNGNYSDFRQLYYDQGSTGGVTLHNYSYSYDIYPVLPDMPVIK